MIQNLFIIIALRRQRTLRTGRRCGIIWFYGTLPHDNWNIYARLIRNKGVAKFLRLGGVQIFRAEFPFITTVVIGVVPLSLWTANSKRASDFGRPLGFPDPWTSLATPLIGKRNYFDKIEVPRPSYVIQNGSKIQHQTRTRNVIFTVVEADTTETHWNPVYPAKTENIGKHRLKIAKLLYYNRSTINLLLTTPYSTGPN